jgi:hypothetical protein
MDNKNQKKLLYIAYGSNINLWQMALRCPHSKPLDTTMLKGWELEFRGVANITEKKDAQTPILLWELDPRDVPRLDRYEGCPNSYFKENIEFEVNGEKCVGMAYLMTKDTRQINPPSSYDMQTIWEGYLENGMDTSYLVEAAARAYDYASDMNIKYDESLDDDIQMSFKL